MKIENVEVVPKPETFNFLGFTIYCSISYDTKRFVVKVKTDSNKFRNKIKMFLEWIKSVRTIDEDDIIKTYKRKLIGHYNYYGVTYNFEGIMKYYYITLKLVYKWLNRRSQKRSFNYEKFMNKVNLEWCLPKPKICYDLLDYTYS